MHTCDCTAHAKSPKPRTDAACDASKRFSKPPPVV